MLRRLACLAAGAGIVLLAAPAPPAAAQVSEYEMRYGAPVEVSLDNLLQMPESYTGRAVRTRGPLEMVPAMSVTYCLRSNFGGRLYLYAVPDAQMDWEREARQWAGREVEVTGAVQMSAVPSAGESKLVSLVIWAFVGPPDEKKRAVDSAPVTLADLVTKPGRHAGKTVTVRGQFRGSNLFGDLPSASRQRSSDWVLKDDVFAVWVSGKKAKGPGWTLDPSLRRDTGKWLQVTGRVRAEGGFVTIEATEVVLSKPVAAAAQAQAQPPPLPPPRPKKPPVVVFSLPLDGERDVPPDTVFRVQFSRDMDEESFKDRVLFRYAGRTQPGDNALDAVRVTYDGGLRTLNVDPGDLLRPGRVVELLLLPGILDLDGQPLETRPGHRPGTATDVLRFQVAAGPLLSGPSP
jgi:hypothetical protein